MIGLNTPINLSLIQGVTHGAWKWWIGELRSSLPQSILRRFAPARAQLEMRVDSTEAIISHGDPNKPEEFCRLPFSGEDVDASLATRFRALDRPRVAIRLASDQVLFRELELPASAKDSLRQIVALDLDRQTPFTASGAVFDVVIREGEYRSDRIGAVVALVRLDTIERIEALCAGLGLQPNRLGVESENPLFRKFSFLRAKGKRTRRRVRINLSAALAIAVVLLLGVNIAVAFLNVGNRVTSLSDELAAARREAQAAEKLKAQLRHNQSEQRVIGEARKSASALATIKSLTQNLPDDVWLCQLDILQGHVKIAGYAPSAPDVMVLLEKSDAFSAPKFTAPVTRGNGQAGEDRFEIGFDVHAQAPK
jgi:general secretion pathway protein L